MARPPGCLSRLPALAASQRMKQPTRAMFTEAAHWAVELVAAWRGKHPTMDSETAAFDLLKRFGMAK